jgi:hypothetical protein
MEDNSFDIALCKLIRWGLSLAERGLYRSRTEKKHLILEFRQAVHILLDQMAKRLPELKGISSSEKYTFFREYKKNVFRLSAWIEESITGVSNKENFPDIYDEYLGLLQQYRLMTELTANEAKQEYMKVLTGYQNNQADEIAQSNGKPGDEIKTTPKTKGKVVDTKCWIRIWSWVKRHPHCYGLTGGFIFLVLFFVVGLFKSQWRDWCWGTAALAFLVLIFSLLGGRTR